MGIQYVFYENYDHAISNHYASITSRGIYSCSQYDPHTAKEYKISDGKTEPMFIRDALHIVIDARKLALLA